MPDSAYARGRRVELVHTTDQDTDLRPGDRGTVRVSDDLGTVCIAWDRGSRLGMSAHAGDRIRPIDE